MTQVDGNAGPSIDRRAFVATAAASALSVALTGCASGATWAGGGDGGRAEQAVREMNELAEGGEWKPVACAHGCTNNCTLQGYVKDGKVLRIRTDQLEGDSFERFQTRACVKGRAARFKWNNEGRLKYPMKRKGWKPGGGENSNGQMRGRDEWERISWDEAIELTASEIKRVRESYGNTAILTPGFQSWIQDLHPGRLMDCYGGCVTTYGDQSQGAWGLVNRTVYGGGQFVDPFNDRFSLLDAKLLVLWGKNVAWTMPNCAWLYRQVKENGTKIVVVDPWLSPTAQSMADEWIAVRPGTDQYLMLGMAYHMVENGLQDQEFLDTYTVGFDAAHMPADAKDDRNFKGYLLGEYDGVAKTPEWAQRYCGVPADTIRAFAEELATSDPVTMSAGLGPARTDTGSSFAWLFYVLAWMTGNIGRSGAEATMSWDYRDPILTNAGLYGADCGIEVKLTDVCPPARGNNKANKMKIEEDTPFQGLAYCDVYDAILTGEYADFGRGKKPIDIRLIYEIGYGAPLNQTSDLTRGIEAYRKVEFVVVSDYFMTADAQYADIVLPAASSWERPGTDILRQMNEIDFGDGGFSFGVQVSEPAYEAKNDYEIELLIGRALGLKDEEVFNISLEQAAFNKLANATYLDFDGEYKPIATITNDQIEKCNVEGKPQEGLVDLEELYRSGRFSYPFAKDQKRVIAFKDFVADPVANPLPTPSGKLEIRCETFAEWNNSFGYNTLDALPVVEESTEGYEKMFEDWDNQVKGEYTFQLVSVHHMAHSHSEMDNIPEIVEFWPNDLIINTNSAQEIGVESGDTVLVESAHGKIVRRVNVTPRILPGVAIIGQGNKPAYDDEKGIDFGGSANTLAGSRLIAQAYQPWNSCLVKISKYEGKALPFEYQRVEAGAFALAE